MTTWQRAQLFALGHASDLLVVVVEAWAKRLARWFPKTTVLHLPVGNNVPAVPVERATLRKELGIPEEAFVLGWLGRGLEYRAEWLDDAIRAAAHAGTQPFVVHVGVGGDHAAQTLNGTPAKITGLVTTEEVSRHLSAFDVYLAPISEGLSSRRTSVIAALAHRVPVVATLGPSTEAVFRTENGRSLVLVDPEHGESFGAAVARLATSPKHRAELGRCGELFAAEHFSWESIGRKLIHELTSLTRT
jgi:glycosyltransferase involved in cell wall biosynthesis